MNILVGYYRKYWPYSEKVLHTLTTCLTCTIGPLNWMTSLKKKVMMTTPQLRRQSFPVQAPIARMDHFVCLAVVADTEINKSILSPPVLPLLPMAGLERPL